MDVIKEIFDALNTRIRSPIFGSIAIAFLLWNWKSLFYLAFSDSTVSAKFIYFDANTTFWSLTFWPILIGFLLAIASPWIAWLGSWIAETPTRKRKLLQIQSRHEILTEKAAFKETRRQMQASREQAIIDAAKIDQEVAEIDDEKIREETEKKIVSARQDDQLAHNLNERPSKKTLQTLTEGITRQKYQQDQLQKLETQLSEYRNIRDNAQSYEGIGRTKELDKIIDQLIEKLAKLRRAE